MSDLKTDVTLSPTGGIEIFWVVSRAHVHTMNRSLRSHWGRNNAHTASARQAVGLLTKQHVREHGPMPTPVVVTVQQTWADSGKPDPGAPMPEIKAWIDGVVDAGLIPDDTGEHVIKIEFLAPSKGRKKKLVMAIAAANRRDKT